MRMKRTIYIIIGCISVVLGIIGIFVPGLPTTPFLLLSSWLFYNSSKRLHNALHRSKWLGPYLRRFQERKGVGWKTKSGVDSVYVDDDFYFGFRGFRELACAFAAFGVGGDRDV